MTHTNYSSRSTHITSIKLDIDENLLLVFRLHAAKSTRRAARLQLTWEAVFHPLLPRQHLPLLGRLFAKRTHLCPKLIHLVVLLGLELMQT